MSRAIALLAAIVATVAVGCGPAGSASQSPASRGPLTVTGAWARAAAAGGETAAHFTVVNAKSARDTLVGASTDAAQPASVHLTSTDACGMTGTKMAPAVPIPAAAPCRSRRAATT